MVSEICCAVRVRPQQQVRYSWFGRIVSKRATQAFEQYVQATLRGPKSGKMLARSRHSCDGSRTRVSSPSGLKTSHVCIAHLPCPVQNLSSSPNRLNGTAHKKGSSPKFSSTLPHLSSRDKSNTGANICEIPRPSASDAMVSAA